MRNLRFNDWIKVINMIISLFIATFAVYRCPLNIFPSVVTVDITPGVYPKTPFTMPIFYHCLSLIVPITTKLVTNICVMLTD